MRGLILAQNTQTIMCSVLFPKWIQFRSFNQDGPGPRRVTDAWAWSFVYPLIYIYIFKKVMFDMIFALSLSTQIILR